AQGNSMGRSAHAGAAGEAGGGTWLVVSGRLGLGQRHVGGAGGTPEWRLLGSGAGLAGLWQALAAAPGGHWLTPRAAFGVTPLEGGRTQWPGKAGSTGALDGLLSLHLHLGLGV